MYTKVSLTLPRLLRGLWKIVVFLTAYTIVLYLLGNLFELARITIPLTVPTVLGTAISLFLGFRTNAAYNRWWEARKVWGAIVNDSRSLIRQANAFFKEDEEKKATVLKLANLQIAWCYALKNNLRGLPTAPDNEKYLDDADREYVNKHASQHTAILQLEADLLREVHAKGKMNDYQFTEMDRTLSKLSNSMGMCERIKKTVFPVQYSYVIRLSIILYMLMLPFSLIQPLGLFVVPVVFLVASFFSLIEVIARYMQDPFENRENDTPMSAISRTIEVNLLQLAGQEEVPEMIQPDEHGILM